MKTLVKYSITAAAFCLTCGAGRAAAQQQGKAPKQYDVAAYVYPAYVSDDPRLRPFWPMGIGEWETVMTMQQRNPGHYWDRKPLWGYVNEADPAVMSMEIEQATRHGVNVFIFDWYWYDGRPFMETTLDNGFLKAGNVDKMRFYLMWANHDVLNHWDTRLARVHEQNVIWTGKVDREEFEKICRRNIEKYFKHPQYYKIDGKPVFMVYDLPQLIAGLGGVEQTADAAEQTLRNEEREEGQFLTGRFSPGYGDYPIAVQNDLLRLLDAPRKIGLCATPAHLLTPRKSVTAVLGVAGHPVTGRRAGCANCALRERCAYRKEGKTCE